MHYRLRGALVVFLILIVQTTFLPFIAIEGFVPDLALIWLVYYALRRGQGEATVAGFLTGLAEDLMATQLFGLAALSKTLAGFFAGYFFNENKTEQTLGTPQFMMIVGLSSLVHTIVFYTIILQGSDVPLVWTVLSQSMATTAYTTAMSALPMFAFSRRRST